VAETVLDLYVQITENRLHNRIMGQNGIISGLSRAGRIDDGTKKLRRYYETEFREIAMLCGLQDKGHWRSKLLVILPISWYKPTDEWQEQVDDLIDTLKDLSAEESDMLHWKLLGYELPQILENSCDWIRFSAFGW